MSVTLLKCPGILFQIPDNQSKYHSYAKVETSMFSYWLCVTKICGCRNRVAVLKGLCQLRAPEAGFRLPLPPRKDMVFGDVGTDQ